MKPLTFLAPALAALVLAGCAGTSSSGRAGDSSRNTASSPAPATSTGAAAGAETVGDSSMPPWPAPANVADRVAQAGLNLGPMGTAEHYHPHLRIVIGDSEVPVAANIGVDPITGAMSALHTHEGDGTIHIEADTEGEVFTLGQLFTEWGVALTPTQVGGVHAPNGTIIEVTSNGIAVPGDPRAVRLQPNQQIVVSLG